MRQKETSEMQQICTSERWRQYTTPLEQGLDVSTFAWICATHSAADQGKRRLVAVSNTVSSLLQILVIAVMEAMKPDL